MAEANHQRIDSECLNTDVELLMFDPDTHFGEYFGVTVVPTERVSLRCLNCRLGGTARVGFNSVAIALSAEPEGVCVNLRSEPNGS